ncbi:chloride channel protein [Nitrosomonas sp. PY1]|uniref:chloride channel protein n=1 Tax=Nitrosomonas sp. PY1 TaxID=1803906 RepID=UPI001FC7D5DD|nr:chloride channel protein [Nitrosomonas sp. PY1]GKS69548.1 chloride channel protein [Nitrosomonas sp. PY1]
MIKRKHRVEEVEEDEADNGNRSMLVMSLLAIGIGILTGLGAGIFRALIALIYNIFYLGRFSFDYDANLLDPVSPWGPWIILSPIIGGIVAVWLVRNFAPEAKGHGVPEVMDAIFYKGGNIRGAVAVIKSLASAFSIGTGAAVGREGPIIQIGAALGSAFSRMLGLTTTQKITLLSAGAGAGIAATFNTPLGGVLFAVEILLPEISNRTFLPVVLACGAATYVGRLIFGVAPAFVVPDLTHAAISGVTIWDIGVIAALGGVCGIAAWAFVKGLAYMEDFFPTLPGGAYVQVVLGMSVIGLMMYGFTLATGHPYINGVGYGMIQSVLDGHMIGVQLLLLLFIAKLAATSISLGCGASGGVFSPLLFMGAALGGAIGVVANMFSPDAANPTVAAMIGMAAMVGAGTGGVMTAIVMIFEMTLDYSIMVPCILTVAIASGVRQALISDTVYTIKLRHRGHQIPQDRHANLFLVEQTKNIMETEFLVVEAGSRLIDILQNHANCTSVMPPVVVSRNSHIVGLVPPRSSLWPKPLTDPNLMVDELADLDVLLVQENDLLGRLFFRMKWHNKEAAIVVTGDGVPRVEDIRGIVTKRAIANTVIASSS